MPKSLYPKEPFPFRDDGNVLYVHFLFMNQGDCTFVEIPEGDGEHTNLLLDLGLRDRARGTTGGLGALKTFMKGFIPSINHTIHYALVSHWHKDHCSDFDKLLKHPTLAPLQVWAPAYWPHPDFQREFFNKIFPVFMDRFQFIKGGDPAIFDNGLARIEVLGPTPASLDRLSEKEERYGKLMPVAKGGYMNNLSLVVRLTFCGKTVLCPGDIGGWGWSELAPGKRDSPKWVKAMRSILYCDLLKVPHHGATSKVLRSLLRAGVLAPQYAVSTFQKTVGRILSPGWRQKWSPVDDFLRPAGSTQQDLIEAVYHTGNVRQFPARASCTFAFVPNLGGTSATIVPMIYKRQPDGKMVYYVRPCDQGST